MMQSNNPSSRSTPSITPLSKVQKHSCVLCKERKIKCDRTEPCAPCRKAGVHCVFQARNPSSFAKRQNGESDETPGRKKRMKKYEAMLRRAGVEISGPAKVVSNTQSPYSINSSADISGQWTQGTLFQHGDKTFYVDSGFMENVSAEAHEEAMQSSSEEAEEEGSQYVRKVEEEQDERKAKQASHMLRDDDFGASLLLGIVPENEQRPRHPDPSTILRLWQIFLDNCDPILKVTHTPTLQQEIVAALDHLDDIPKPLEALLFSIYTLAIVSLSAEECQTIFRAPKTELERRYRDGTRWTLLNANFLRTTEITVLVAFVLLIASLARQGDFETRWELSGVAMRIAQRMGLHKNPESLGLNPFDCEMRRRIWNRLYVVDTKLGESAGCKTSLPPDAEDIGDPINCSDSALYSNMKHPPLPQEGYTDMSFIVLRVRFRQLMKDIGGFGWLLSADVPQATKRAAIAKCEESLSDITRNSDMEIPIQAICYRLSQLMLLKLRWVACHPRQPGNENNEEKFHCALDVIEVESNIDLIASVKGLMWHAQNNIQFDAVFFVLHELRKRFTGTEVDRAWVILETLYRTTPIIHLKSSKIFSAIRHMTLAAWESRTAAVGPAARTPDFIKELERIRVKKGKNIALSPTSTLEPSTTSSSLAVSTVFGYPEFEDQEALLPPFEAGMTEDMDWALWDQVFAQTAEPQYGQWMMKT